MAKRPQELSLVTYGAVVTRRRRTTSVGAITGRHSTRSYTCCREGHRREGLVLILGVVVATPAQCRQPISRVKGSFEYA
jgi:hypothetical protein